MGRKKLLRERLEFLISFLGVLNHKKKGLRGVYNLYEYDREKQQALELWVATVLALVKTE